MKRKDTFTLRKVAGKYVIMPTGSETFKFDGIISINETGAFLWEKLENDITEEELAAAVCAEYDIDTETALADVREFLSSVRNAGIIE